MKSRTVVTGLVVAALALAPLALIARHFAVRRAEASLIELHRNGTATPAAFGAPSSLVWFRSGGRRLQASVTLAPAPCPGRTALLIFHGRGETLSDWAGAQAFLSRACVASMVFDYSGHGASDGPAHVETLNEDAASAWRVFVARFPAPFRRCVLGHSMGNAPMLHAYGGFAPPPDCLVAANGFTSVEEMGRLGGAPAPIVFLVHGLWDNTAAIGAVKAPVLVIHSDADRTIPPAVGDRLAAAAPAGARRVTVHGYGHDALYEDPAGGWWTPVLKFIDPLVGSAALR